MTLWGFLCHLHQWERWCMEDGLVRKMSEAEETHEAPSAPRTKRLRHSGPKRTTISDRVHFGGPRPFEPISVGDSPADWGIQKDCADPKSKDFATKWSFNEIGNASGQHLRDYRPKVIAVWMRKGGVSKTNTTYMLGHALASLGCKTMLVDCDSQQDLTELSFRCATEYFGYDDVQRYIKKELIPETAGNVPTCDNLADAVRFTLGQSFNTTLPQPGHATQCKLLKPHPLPVQELTANGIKNIENLFLVQGGHDFDSMETNLAQQYKTCQSGQSPNRNAPGALFHAIWNAGLTCNAEVILLDLSPALGVTNELLLMHCDYFAVPCEVNKLSEKNLKMMGIAIRDMYLNFQENGRGIPRSGIRDVSRGLKTDLTPDPSAELPLPDIEPKFLGIMMNKYDQRVSSKLFDTCGRPDEKCETFRSEARKVQAARLRQAAQDLHTFLLHEDGGDETVSLAAPLKLFFRPNSRPDESPRVTGLGDFRHNFGSNYYPQPYILGLVRKATAAIEGAPQLLGKPMSRITESDFKDMEAFLTGNDKSDKQEYVAHYQRIFYDLARFVRYLPHPKPYNFVFDSRAQKSGSAVASNVVNEYPNQDIDTEVKKKRTARIW